MSQVVRPYRGVSADERRTERRRRLVEATLDVVGVEGVARTTVDRVCAAAGLTKRYFYESFADLPAVLVAAADELFADLLERMGQDVADHGPGADRTEAVVVTLVDTLSGDPRRARLYVESPVHPALHRRREEAIATFTAFVEEHVLPEPNAERSPADRRLATRLLVAGTTDVVTGWLSGAVDADRATVIATIRHMGGAI